MTHEKWLIAHLILAVAVYISLTAYKSRRAENRIIGLAAVLIGAIHYLIGVIFPAYRTFPFGI